MEELPMDRQPARVRRSTEPQVPRSAVRRCACLGLALVALATPAAAGDQQLAGGQVPAKVHFDVRQAFGVRTADGVLWGGGPGFKVRFDAGGVEFTPALGRAAPRNVPLGLHAQSLRRGDTLLWSAASSLPMPPSADGNLVSYALQPGLTERYEVRRDG